jgi:hypothetical protein
MITDPLPPGTNPPELLQGWLMSAAGAIEDAAKANVSKRNELSPVVKSGYCTLMLRRVDKPSRSSRSTRISEVSVQKTSFKKRIQSRVDAGVAEAVKVPAVRQI